jgi:hypothetical protein
MWLVDPRLAQPDLKITGGSVYARPGASQVYVTATIQNGGAITTGAPAYINIYNRRAPSSPPGDPLDLAGGWCSLDQLARPDCPSFNSTVGITNVLRVIGPGKIITLAADLTPTQSGRLDIYMQVDIFGGPEGLNAESDEANNWRNLGQVSVYHIDLPLIVKGYQAP